tara:strand:+ start:2562 stop:4697 length:2136 start_codon:yes stop_codon:yes gene_type:complete
MEFSKDELYDMMHKYDAKLNPEEPVRETREELKQDEEVRTVEYEQFKEENLPKKLGWYERSCNFCEKIVSMKVKPKKARKLQEAIDLCHLKITPSGVVSFSVLGPVAFMFVGSLVSFLLLGSTFFGLLSLILGGAVIIPLAKIPFFFAAEWRMAASNQMVLSVFYIVTYMRHTSNLEKAIEFSSEHLSPPLSLDLKKVLWDVETEKFENIKESLDVYLEGWRETNMEFIQAIHLIESSLYEGSEDRRLSLLDKSLDVILDETYEKMLHYAQNLRQPITLLHMMGIILPILGLVILPLMVSFMENVAWYHIAAIYNVLLPIGVYMLGKNILVKRPAGQGETNAGVAAKKGNTLNVVGVEVEVKHIAWSLGIVLVLIGLAPIFVHVVNPTYEAEVLGFSILEYKVNEVSGESVGPFGFGSAVISLLIPLGIGLGIGLFYKIKSKKLVKIREDSKNLEQEFAGALFQLGNRLGDGLPVELAVGKVSEIMEGTTSGNFFRIVSMNIRRLGMGVKDAIFNKRNGALVYFPSLIIGSSMKVLIQAIQKGPKVAAQALVNISRYIKEIHKVNERLKDLMADIISSMKSQISFLTPVIAGIVIGITSMITNILGKLSSQIQNVSSEGAGAQAGSLANLFGLGIPTFYFQIVVGVYVVQLIFILTIIANGIENGKDTLNEEYQLGRNMVRSTILYCCVAFFVMFVFNFIANSILGATLGA